MLVLSFWLTSVKWWWTDLYQVLQCNFMSTLEEMKYTSLGLQVFSAHSVFVQTEELGNVVFNHYISFLCIFWKNVTDEPKLTKWRGIMLMMKTIWSFKSDFLCQVLWTRIYTCMYTHSHTHSNTWTWHKHINWAVILFHQLWFNKCMRKKIAVIWIYSVCLYILLLCD